MAQLVSTLRGARPFSLVALVVAPVVAGAFEAELVSEDNRALVWTMVTVCAALVPMAILVPLGWAGRLTDRQVIGMASGPPAIALLAGFVGLALDAQDVEVSADYVIVLIGVGLAVGSMLGYGFRPEFGVSVWMGAAVCSLVGLAFALGNSEAALARFPVSLAVYGLVAGSTVESWRRNTEGDHPGSSGSGMRDL